MHGFGDGIDDDASSWCPEQGRDIGVIKQVNGSGDGQAAGEYRKRLPEVSAIGRRSQAVGKRLLAAAYLVGIDNVVENKS